MQSRWYDTLELRTWWETIAAQPASIGMFADYLQEREHVIAPAIRWAYEKGKRPIQSAHSWQLGAWYWVSVAAFFQDWHQRCAVLPRWLMQPKRTIVYESSASAWRNFCRRFVSREKKLGLNRAYFMSHAG